MSYFYEHNLKNKDLFLHIKSLIDLKELYDGVRIKCVCFKKTTNEIESWQNGITGIRFFSKEEAILKTKNRNYPGVQFLEEWIPVSGIIQWLEKLIESSKAVICGKEINFEVNASFKLEFSNREFYSSKHKDFDFPYFWYTTNQSNQVQADPLHKQLIDFDQPFFENGVDALRSWFDERGFRDISDAQRSLVSIFVPEHRAYFGDVENNGHQIKIKLKINHVSESDLKLKGSWRKKEEAISFDSDIKDGQGLLTIPEGVEELYLYIIDRNNKVYDFHQEHKVQYEGQARWLVVEKEETSNDELINKVRLSGEGESIEFKEYLEEKEGEFLDKIRKTVVAFANCRGGTLFLGIDNECQIIGVEKKFQKFLGDNERLLDALSKYEGWLRQAVNDGLYKTLSKPLGFKYVWKNGHLILIVSVQEGGNKPYSFKNKVPYVRHGPNTVIADPETEVQALRQSKAGEYDGLNSSFD